MPKSNATHLHQHIGEIDEELARGIAAKRPAPNVRPQRLQSQYDRLSAQRGYAQLLRVDCNLDVSCELPGGG